MIRLLLIIVLLIQMGCSVLQTAVGTFVGSLSSEVVRDKLFDKDDDEKEKHPEK